MATKTITIMDDAYELLSANKQKDESFSDVIRRIAAKKDISQFAGSWKMSDKEADKVKDAILELRAGGISALKRRVRP